MICYQVLGLEEGGKKGGVKLMAPLMDSVQMASTALQSSLVEAPIYLRSSGSTESRPGGL